MNPNNSSDNNKNIKFNAQVQEATSLKTDPKAASTSESALSSDRPCPCFYLFHLQGKAVALLDILRNIQSSSLNGDGQGIPGTDVYGLTTGFSWNYYGRLSLGATCWFLMAEGGVNPLEVVIGVIF